APPEDITNGSALTIVAILLLGTFAVTACFIIQPLMSVLGHMALKEVVPELAYFAGIGLGFMLIEISQMQRLMVFLGHPVFGLSVVLFTLLLVGGIGSMTVHPYARLRELWRRPLLLCAVLCTLGLITPWLTTQFVASNTAVRILASVALLAPAGFCMGMMFPL